MQRQIPTAQLWQTKNKIYGDGEEETFVKWFRHITKKIRISKPAFNKIKKHLNQFDWKTKTQWEFLKKFRY